MRLSHSQRTSPRPEAHLDLGPTSTGQQAKLKISAWKKEDFCTSSAELEEGWAHWMGTECPGTQRPPRPQDPPPPPQ